MINDMEGKKLVQGLVVSNIVSKEPLTHPLILPSFCVTVPSHYPAVT
jgi:hypothetical protein